jgi:hypothetical protein
MIIGDGYRIQDLENMSTPQPRYKPRLDGYGSRIPSRYMVKLPGEKRWRRVYTCCWSNIGTSYVEINGGKDWIVIR